MIPKAIKCKWCGRDIIMVKGAGGRTFPIEANLTGYKAITPPGEKAKTMYTVEGKPVVGFPMSQEEEMYYGEPDGFAHRFHFDYERRWEK